MEYLFYYIPPAPNRILGECWQDKVNFSGNATDFFFTKCSTKTHSTQEKLI